MVVSGPSGAGKDSLVDELRRIEPDLAYSVSATTRPAREGEREGVHYFFISRPTFEQMDADGAFIETREYANNLYGTPKQFITEALARGRDIVMKPEVNGALAIKRAFPHAVLVFLTAPSEQELARRLERRRTEGADAISKRLEIAREEARHIGAYEYLIVNDSLPTALAKLHAVLGAERLKTSRLHEKNGSD
ncbi:MAG TPA: guanylate kinase [Candidatus Eremiobacteraceae bacterium]|nr:guanylate kinase [Candidatus Eremiobacteraceae bacterium]